MLLAQVAALRAAAEYAVLSEGLGRELCSVVANLLRSHTDPSPTLKTAPLSVILEALSAGRKLLESFPGMQEGVLGPVGSLACYTGGKGNTLFPDMLNKHGVAMLISSGLQDFCCKEPVKAPTQKPAG